MNALGTSAHEAILPDFERVVEALRLMGHGLRLSLLCHLARGEQAVGDLAAATGQSFSLVSQQLALLRKAGLVQTRREAKQVYYALAALRLDDVAAAIRLLTSGASPAPLAAPQAAVAVAAAPVAAPAPANLSAAMFAQVTQRGS